MAEVTLAETPPTEAILTEVRSIPEDELWHINRFYKRNGHKGKARPGDKVWGLYRDESLLAVVRLCMLDNDLLLRGLWVDKHQRLAGLGSLLLQQVCRHYARQTIWCFPFAHLRTFYQRAGFKLADNHPPAKLCNKLSLYRQKGEQVCLMAKEVRPDI